MQEDSHRVRALQIGGRCDVVTELGKWQKSNPAEFERIFAKLRQLARTDRMPKFRTVKRVGGSRQIVEIVGGQTRLFCFYDSPARDCVIVCVETFHIGKGNKKTKQTLAIESAEERRERWKAAKPLRGRLDERLDRGE